MLYDAVCHANLQSVIRYPYPIRIRGIVENYIRIRKNSWISANIYPQFHIRAPLIVYADDIVSGLFEVVLKNLGILGFLKKLKNLKSPI